MKQGRMVPHFLMGSLIAVALCLGGCQVFNDTWLGDQMKTDEFRFLGPDKVIRKVTSPVNPIYTSVGEVDVTEVLPPNATFPEPEDLTYTDTEYVIGPTDVLHVSILDLYETGAETVLQRQVTESGYIDLPLLTDRIMAEGYTKDQLKEVIKEAYSNADILRDPTVAVTVAQQRQNTFSVLGAIARPGTYPLIRKDMRLLEAIAAGGGITQGNVKYVFVIRPKPAIRVRTKPKEAPKALPELPKPAPVTPGPEVKEEPKVEEKAEPIDIDKALQELGAAMPGLEAETQEDGEPKEQQKDQPKPTERFHFTEMSSVSQAATASAEADAATDGKSTKWIHSGGKWIRVTQEAPVAADPAGKKAAPVRPEGQKPQKLEVTAPRKPVKTVPQAQPTPQSQPELPPIIAAPPREPSEPSIEQRKKKLRDPYNWMEADVNGLARVIAIDLEKLRQGNPRLNIVLRDNDIVQVPPLKLGEFYIMGEVQRPGVYSLTGREITVKMALAAAGNLGPLAWPENSVLIRRVGLDQEQILPLDIEAIFAGKEPDLFLKANDVLAVGTHWKTSFMAVLRNAFRMTYGFGMIYDRNFSDPLQGGGEFYDSSRFTRW